MNVQSSPGLQALVFSLSRSLSLRSPSLSLSRAQAYPVSKKFVVVVVVAWDRVSAGSGAFRNKLLSTEKITALFSHPFAST